MLERKILLLGSGYVSGPCLNYLLRRPENKVTIACRTLSAAQKLSNGHPQTIAKALDVGDAAALEAAVATHDITISLIPYIHHAKVIDAAVKHKKHVVTTSYVSPAMAAYDEAAKTAGVTIFNEVGVDPGIDHLYAIKTIEEVHAQGGKVVGFYSFCGGLPAPEASNNPLGYKFSWSSRGVLLALKNDAKYWKDGEVCEVSGFDLMDKAVPWHIYPAFNFVAYPNRDSTPYTERYNIPECKNLIRGTLRYAVFPPFVKALVNLGFLQETPIEFLASSAPEITWKQVLGKLVMVDNLSEDTLIDACTKKAKITPEHRNRIINGFRWLGLFSDSKVHRKENLLDTLCATMDEKMQYAEDERDMVMLQHKFEIEWANGTKENRTSTGLWFADIGGDGAMARTVGVPCAITTQLILDGRITKRGVLAPMTMELCQPIMDELEKVGIKMVEAIE